MIRIIAVGKIKEKSLSSLIEAYRDRILPFHKLTIEEVADEPTSEDLASQLAGKIKEGERILGKIKPEDTVILLDLRGDDFDSMSLAKRIDTHFTYNANSLVFVIGGSMGVSEAVSQRADTLWKLSSCTFPHQIVRLLVLEQIYRAFKINRNQTYHK
jgi:23S rRNA (pseudouridine1915-N3)-methyltransferase